MTQQIDGTAFSRMVRGGLANLEAHAKEVNALNVFPVPDGDTGTNMVLTLKHGLERATPRKELNLFLRDLSDGMLEGSRGNSGVILANFFAGFSNSLGRYEVMAPGNMSNALVYGYRAAYAGLKSPQEGTILTVLREGIEAIRSQISRRTSFEVMLGMYIAQMNVSLNHTPDMLPCLKEAGVVDSGGKGYIYLVEGMLQVLNGERDPYASDVSSLPQAVQDTGSAPDLSLFHADSVFDYGYCMEFLLQLMNGDGYQRNFSTERFTEDLERFGNSLVISRTNTRVKIHIHTKKPARIIELAQNYGEFVTFKLENMCIQHNEIVSRNFGLKKQDLYKICVTCGEGMEEFFRNAGADIVLDGGDTMNTSSGEFAECYRACLKANPDACILVFPNNSNVAPAALQAVSLVNTDRVTVLESKSCPQGYFGIAFDNPTDSREERTKAARQGIASSDTVSVVRAGKTCTADGVSCVNGEYFSTVNGCVKASSGLDFTKCLTEAIRGIPGIEDKETCLAFAGRDADGDTEALLTEALEEEFPDLELCVVPGDQAGSLYTLGLI